jgi:hypothetical protein
MFDAFRPGGAATGSAHLWVLSDRAIPGQNSLLSTLGKKELFGALNAEGGAEVTVY